MAEQGRPKGDELLHMLELLNGGTVSNDTRDPERLVLDLAAHQIELEMQNRELRAAQAALEESRNGYADLFDFAPVALCMLDQQGVVDELNLGCSRLFKVPRLQAIGVPLMSVVRFSDPTRLGTHLANIRRSLTSTSDQFELLIDGSATYVEAVSVPILDSYRRVLGFRMAMTDVTERRSLEERAAAMHANERRMRVRFEALDAASFSISRALTASGSFDVRAALAVIIEQVRRVAGGAEVEVTFGGESVRTASPIPSEGGCSELTDRDVVSIALCFAGVERGRLTLCRTRDAALDAGEQRTLEMLAERAAAALEVARIECERERDARRRALLDGATQRLAGLSTGDEVLVALRSIGESVVPELARAMLGYRVARSGEADLLFVQPAGVEKGALARWTRPHANAPLYDVVRTRQALRSDSLDELLGLPRDASASAAMGSVLAVPLVARGRTLGVFCFGLGQAPQADVYEVRPWAEELALRCAHALDTAMLLDELRAAVAAREHVLATVSHDLRSPLNAISLSASVLADTNGSPERQRTQKQVDLIKRSARRMSHLVGDLVLARNIETGGLTVDLKPENAGSLIAEAYELVEASAASKGVTFERGPGAGLPAVWADRERVLQVFSNLVGNAIKFTPAGGTVRLYAERKAGAVEFFVSDTGPGISAVDRDRVFDAYWTAERSSNSTTRRSAGLGLGLSIAKGIVQAHSGTLRVESKEGEGSTFSFTLPAVPD